MPDLEVLRDLTPQFPPPGLDDLAAVVRRRRRRAVLTAGAGTLAAVVVVATLLGGMPRSVRSTDPVDDPTDGRTSDRPILGTRPDPRRGRAARLPEGTRRRARGAVLVGLRPDRLRLHRSPGLLRPPAGPRRRRGHRRRLPHLRPVRPQRGPRRLARESSAALRRRLGLRPGLDPAGRHPGALPAPERRRHHDRPDHAPLDRPGRAGAGPGPHLLLVTPVWRGSTTRPGPSNDSTCRTPSSAGLSRRRTSSCGESPTAASCTGSSRAATSPTVNWTAGPRSHRDSCGSTANLGPRPGSRPSGWPSPRWAAPSTSPWRCTCAWTAVTPGGGSRSPRTPSTRCSRSSGRPPRPQTPSQAHCGRVSAPSPKRAECGSSGRFYALGYLVRVYTILSVESGGSPSG